MTQNQYNEKPINEWEDIIELIHKEEMLIKAQNELIKEQNRTIKLDEETIKLYEILVENKDKQISELLKIVDDYRDLIKEELLNER